MTRTLLCFALGLAGPALADDRGARCAGLGETAAKVMEARQLSIPEGQLLALASDGPAVGELTWVVREAYEEPVYGPEWQKQAAMAEFARLIEASCLAG